MACKDTKARYQGVYARHQDGCAVERDKRCNCAPKYFGVAWDPNSRRPRKTKHYRLATDARDARLDLRDALRRGEASVATGSLHLGEGVEKFIKGAKEGVVLNKWRRPYRPRAVDDLEALKKHIPPEMARRRVTKITRGEVQGLVDDLTRKLSASRVSSVVNALRAFYRWAQEREYAMHDPAQHVRLPLSDAQSRDRVVSPPEFDRLLKALWEQTPEEIADDKERDPREALKDALPYALAVYATARRQEVEVLDWLHVKLELAGGELAGDEAGRKPGGSWRIVPYVKPLLALLREEWLAQGKPTEGKVCRPRQNSKSGRKSMARLQQRVKMRWEAQGLEPINLQEARHTAATWLDHAGVSPKVSSQIMGHKTPEYQPGAARITLGRYTHMLSGELERARELLDAFIAERLAEGDKVAVLR